MVVEEGVSGIGHGVSNSHGCGVNSSSWSQMGVLSHVFEGVRLFAHGVEFSTNFRSLHVSSVNGSQKLSGSYGQFDGLSGTLTFDEGSDKLKGSPGSARRLARVESLGLFRIEDALKGLSGRTVIEFDKQQLSLVGIARRSAPTGNRDCLVEILRPVVGHDFLDADAVTAIQVGFDGWRGTVQHNSASAALGSEIIGKLEMDKVEHLQ